MTLQKNTDVGKGYTDDDAECKEHNIQYENPRTRGGQYKCGMAQCLVEDFSALDLPRTTNAVLRLVMYGRDTRLRYKYNFGTSRISSSPTINQVFTARKVPRDIYDGAGSEEAKLLTNFVGRYS